MRQIVVDNVHYCTMKQIMERAKEEPKDVERKKRNAQIKETAKKVIVREEKLKYGKEGYKKVLRQR